MIESDNSIKYRACFKKSGQQRQWLENCGLSVSEMAALCQCSERTIRDWRREKFSVDHSALVAIASRARLPVPEVEKFPYFSHASAAGRLGAAAVMRKYGRVPVDEEIRKQSWYDWWQREGKFNPQNVIGVPLKVKRPRPSRRLAEFVGIMMGDGGISDHQLTVTLHAEDDLEYGSFVSGLITDLFDAPVSVRPRRNCKATDYVVSRKSMVDYCVDHLGLKRGHKIRQGLTIPGWIISDVEYTKACVRGLFDTDGSVFTHAYRVKGKEYRYKKMAFTSRSQPLLRDVHEVLNNIGIKARCAGSDIRIDSVEAVSMYMKMISTHNPKHLKRYAT